MKKIYCFLLFTLICLLSVFQISAQSNSIVVNVLPRTSSFPASGLSYIEDATKYFTVNMTNISGAEQNVYIGISLSCNFAVAGNQFSFSTKPTVAPSYPLTLSNGQNTTLTMADYNSLLNGVQYDMQGIQWQDVLLLPEGNYELCVTAYQWTQGGANPSPIELGKGCTSFTICYSGSAPEFVTPVVGQSAANLNISNPLDAISDGIQQGSDNRASSQYASIPLQQKLTFRWSGVVSNCLTSNMFRYVMKIVEINPYQNALSAIQENATLATIDNGSALFYTYDTIKDRQFRLLPGHAYAAQVEAVPKSQYSNSIINLGNEGKSQVIAFVWGDAVNGVTTNQQNGSSSATTTSSVKDNKEEVLKGFYNHYVATPFCDATTKQALVDRFSDESSFVPKADEFITHEVDGETIYTVQDTNTIFTASWMPLRSDSISSLVYNAYLYKYIGGDVSNSLAFQPVVGLQFNNANKYTYSPSNHNLFSLEYPGWERYLETGEQYVLWVDASVIYRYAKTTTYTTTEYINGIPLYNDSTVTNVCLDAENFKSYVIFQWGIDKNALTKVSPAEFSYPTYTTDGGDSWDQIPDVQKDEDFEFMWNPASGVSVKDTVKYDFFICKLKKGMTPKMCAAKDTLYYKLNLDASVTSIINDTIRDSLKVGESYVAYLKTRVTTHAYDYNVSNDGVSKYAVFKLISIDTTARLNKTIECNPGHDKTLDQTAVTPSTDSLIKEKVRLKMGEMPLVIQKVTKKDDKKKTYTGEGYVVWKPFSYGDVCIKVQFDSIKINANNEIISGTAKSISQDNSNYVNMDFGYGWTDWTDDKIDWLASKYGQKDYVKNYYNEVNKYANYVNGFRGVFEGEDIGLGVFTLPMRLDDEVFSGSKNVKMTIGEMYFTPNTALMNMTAIFNSNSDNMYVPFVATNICMSPTSILGNIDQGIDLYLARNYEVNMSDGYTMRFKAADTLGKPDNGCYISFDTSGFKLLAADIQIDFDPQDLYKADLKNNGTVMKGRPVQARFYTKIYDWDDWTATITMDAFAFPGAEDYTFIPSGRGIVLDHSKKETPKIVNLPADYVPAKKDDKPSGGAGGTGGTSGGGSGSGSGGKTPIGGGAQAGAGGAGGAGGSGGAGGAGGKGGNKPKPAPAEWQGFYVQQIAVLFPDNVSNTFVDINGNTEPYKDSMLVYKYGINDTQKDSSYFYYSGSRITAGLQNLIIDTAGISVTGYVSDIFKAETDKGGGWAISLDTIAIQFEKSEFKQGRFVGQVGMPLFKGKLEYGLALGSKELKFNLAPKDTNFKLDLWLANIALDKKSSHFTITSNDTVEKTLIDLSMNGKINIDFDKIGIPVEFAAVKFENMYLRNYNKTDSTDFKFEGLDFDAGRWSKASPQKYLNVSEEKKNAMFSGSVGGFSFNVYTLSPIFENISGKKYKAGIAVSGDIGISVGDCSNGSISAGTGFKVWGEVNVDFNNFDVSNPSGEMDSVWLECDLDMFKLNGRLDFFRKDDTYGDGLRGSVKCEIMKKVKFGVGAGFGTVKKPDSDDTYDWWYIEGVANCNPGIPLGAVNLTGLGGGFAYNMEPKQTGQNTDPRALRKAGQNTSFTDAMVSSGMEFKPKYDAWVAKAGVALALEDENTMNADGRISLRVADGHFTGFMMQVNASVITHYDKQNDTNSNATINVGALIDVEDTKEKFMFNFSACVESKIDLTSLLKDAAAAAVPLDIDYPDVGELMNSTTGDFLKSTNSELAKADAEDKKKNNGQNSSSNTPDEGKKNDSHSIGGSASLKIPIDLMVTHFHEGVSEHTGTADEWCFSIGRPPYDERVSFSMDADLVVCKAEASFTFYFAIGNYFPGGFTLPDIPSDVAEFLGKDYEKAKKKRIVSMPDAGGFAMGASFNAKVEFDMFLYVDVNAWIGFDVALMNVHGQGCEGYDQIGKNNFYALGQAYAMLEGDVGLSLNLGFWKGHLSLLSLGVGALLQGGGPQPTWCYGLLRFKASCLGGLIKINTSVDFDLGDVCVPGAGDPLANVKLLESVTPGYEDVPTARNSDNRVTPFAQGMITSNMPWDEDILLCSNTDEEGNPIDMRRFRFTLWEPYMEFGKAPDSEEKPAFKSVNYNELNFTRSYNNSSIYYFDTKEGGFYANTTHKVKLVARAFEKRTFCSDCAISDTTKYKKKNNFTKDVPYNLENKSAYEQFDPSEQLWYNPTFFVDNKHPLEVHPFIQDTTVYFTAGPLPENLTEQVLLTWPYNGDPFVPVEELDGYAYIYFVKERDDLFNPSKLRENGKILKAFLVKREGVQEKIGTEINSWQIQHVAGNGGPSHLKVKLPDEIKTVDPTMFQLKFYIMDEDQYNAQYNQQVMSLQQEVVTTTQEVQGRDLLNIMSDVVGQTSTSTTTTTNTMTGSSSSSGSASGQSSGSGNVRVPAGTLLGATAIPTGSTGSGSTGTSSSATASETPKLPKRGSRVVASSSGSTSGTSTGSTSTGSTSTGTTPSRVLAGTISSSSDGSVSVTPTSSQLLKQPKVTLKSGASGRSGRNTASMNSSQELANARPVTLMLGGSVSADGSLANANVVTVNAEHTTIKSMPVGNNKAAILSAKAPMMDAGKMMNDMHATAQFSGNLNLNNPTVNLNPSIGVVDPLGTPSLGGGKIPSLPGGGNTVLPGVGTGGGTGIGGTGIGGTGIGGTGIGGTGIGGTHVVGTGGLGGTITNPNGGTNINPGQGGLGGGSTSGLGGLGGLGAGSSHFGGFNVGNYHFNSGAVQDRIVEVSVSNSFRNREGDLGRDYALINGFGDSHNVSNSETTDSKVVDIRQAQINEAVAEYNEEGADTMMNYTRTKVNTYAICQQIGNVVYTLYFRTAGKEYDKYYKVFDAIKRGLQANPNWSSKLAHTSEGSTTKTTLPAVNDQSQLRILYTYAYLFKSFKPQDPAMYMSGITLPPIANFVVHTEPSISGAEGNTNSTNVAYALHEKYKDQLDKYYSFCQYHWHVPQTRPHQKNDWKNDFDGWGGTNDLNTSNMNSSVWQWTRHDNNATFQDEEYRALNNGMNVNTGRYGFNSNWWSVPNILDVNVVEKNPCRIDSSYFVDMSKSFPVKGDNPTMTIVDKVTSALYSDLASFHSLFQDMFGYAMSYDARGYTIRSSSKAKTLEADMDAPNSKYLSFDDFLIKIPRVCRDIAYFNAFNWLYKGTYTSAGTTFTYDYSDTFKSVGSYNASSYTTEWYSYWLFTDELYMDYGHQGLYGPRSGKYYRDNMMKKPFFKGLVDKLPKANEEQYVFIEIDYLSSSRGTSSNATVSEVLEDLATNVRQVATNNRPFRATSRYTLGWKFNLNSITGDQVTKLTKYNALKLYESGTDIYTKD